MKDFGLNSYEAKLWIALLSRGISTAGELSDIANVPRSRSYDVLESLEKKGFIVMKIGKPIKYIAVSPNEAIERVKKKIKQDADEQEKVLSNLNGSELLEDLRLLHSQGIDFVESSDLSGSFKGRDAIYNHMDSMIKRAAKSVDIITSSEGLLRKAKSLKNAFKKANDNGVKIRVIAPVTAESKDLLKNVSKFAEIRSGDTNSRFCIVDDSELMFMLLDDKEVHSSYDTGVWVNTKMFSGALKGLFNSKWKNSKEF